ncbi:MAG: hypothetical protein IPP91_19770 [Betaproteobacteria bacterium]|nr:hypothetical protein [Betaproteobacteria bacterium]
MSLLNTTAPAPALVRAIRRALRPMVRLMLASGVTYPLMAELLKGVFVELAEREFRLGARKMSDSRISLLSGVHRKDVRRLRGSDTSAKEVVPESVSLGGRLVTTWLSDERFLDEDGNARPLPRARTNGARVCFEDLVASRSTDIRPRVVLDEWLRLGVVRIDEQDRLVLNADAFVPPAGLDEKLFFFAHNLHDHAAAATENLLGNRPPRFERSLMYEGLTQSSVEHVEKRAHGLGMKMLTDLNRVATTREESEAASPEPRQRITCGIYFYSEPVGRE